MRMLLTTAVLLLVSGCMSDWDAKWYGKDTGYAGYVDHDGDGYDESVDCDDADPGVNPGMIEMCDSRDNDCDGFVDDDDPDLADGYELYVDTDADGFGSSANTTRDCDGVDAGYVADRNDCDDTNASINPDANEVCDGIDNNCNGIVDSDADPSETLTWFADADSDGFGDGASMIESCTQPTGHVADSTDCNDADPAVNPDADEYCDNVDNNCNGDVDEADAVDSTDWYLDADADAYGDPSVVVTACNQPMGYTVGGMDCDDTDPNINPDANEVCDSIDNDCDALVDDADPNVDPLTYVDWFADNDGDGFGDVSIATAQCDAPSGFVANNTDCDDANASISPAEREVCGDEVDNNCDPTDDEDGSDWILDADGDGYGEAGGTSVSDCADLSGSGYSLSADDCDDTDASTYPGADEYCDSIDNDCDGDIDEADALDAATWYRDYDEDGYGDTSVTEVGCSASSGYVADNTDCDDYESAANPGATEICDSIDNNCEGTVDGSSEVVDGLDWFADTDGDGYGDAYTSAYACDAPSGYISDSTDCDDTDLATYPGATEICDTLDNDCDGDVDEGLFYVSYADVDGDGFGDASSTLEDCVTPSGYVADATDCDDADASIYPGADEYCDSIDNDCDSTVDEEAVDASTWYADTDTDGYGDVSYSLDSCTALSGYVSVYTDCDDADASVNPGANEVCDSIDNDCDGLVDDADSSVDASTFTTWYADTDADGFGDVSNSLDQCNVPSGYVVDATDCDDADSSINPDAGEYCDSIDNDCDGLVDDADTEVVDAYEYYLDADGDGFGDETSTLWSCTSLTGYVEDGSDCDDTNADVNPDGVELDWSIDNCSDSIDNNCDGDTDGADWECMDIDSDGVGNAVDSAFPYDMDSDGITETVCVTVDLYATTTYGSVDGYYVGVGFSGSGGSSYFSSDLDEACYDFDGDGAADNVAYVTTVDVDGEDIDAQCADLSVPGDGSYYIDFVSGRSAYDELTDVDTNDCHSFEYVDLPTYCIAYDDPYCIRLTETDRCSYVYESLAVSYTSTGGVTSTH